MPCFEERALEDEEGAALLRTVLGPARTRRLGGFALSQSPSAPTPPASERGAKRPRGRASGRVAGTTDSR